MSALILLITLTNYQHILYNKSSSLD